MKQIFKTIAIIIALCVLAVACVEDNEFILPEGPNTEKPEGGNEDNKENGEDDGKEDGKDDGGKDEPTPEPPIYNDYPDTAWAAGELDWVFDMNVLPEIRISVTEEQWNELLKEYDSDSNTAEYIHCDAEFKSKCETHNFVDAGLRLRGTPHAAAPRVMVVRCTSVTMPTGTTATLCSTCASIRRMMPTSCTTCVNYTSNGTRMTVPTAVSYTVTTSSAAMAYGPQHIVPTADCGYT